MHRGADGQDGLGQVGWDILCLVWRQLLLVRLAQEGHGSEVGDEQDGLRRVGWDMPCLVWRQLLPVRLDWEESGDSGFGQT